MLVKEFIEKHPNACQEAQEFLGSYSTMEQAWDACKRLDWMFWALDAEKIELPKEVSVAFACWCTRNTPLGDGRTTWDLLTDERSRAGVEAAEKFMRGEITQDEMHKAAESAAEYAESAARHAMYAAVSAEYAAMSAEYATMYAMYARYAAKYAALHAEYAAGYDKYAAKYAAMSAAMYDKYAAMSARSARSARYAMSAQAKQLKSLMGNPFVEAVT